MYVSWPRKSMPNVYLFEPHPLAIECLRSTLKRINQLSVLPCLESMSALTAAQISRSVFIFDMVTHGSAVAVSLGRLLSQFPDAKAILLASVCGPEEQFEMLSMGFKGVIVYDDVADKLLTAIVSVASGGYWMDSAILAQYVMGRTQKSAAGLTALTQREGEVARLLRRKLSNKEISASLDMSEGTVKFHIANIFSKLGVRDRWSAAELMTLDEGCHPPRTAANRADTTSGMQRDLRAS